MRVFEVSVNGEQLCIAGIDGACVLNAMVTHVKANTRDELDLSVGGLVSGTGEHITWTQIGINVGDEVRVRTLESDLADEPSSRTRRQPEAELEAQKTYVRQMAKEFGWTLVEPPGQT